MIELRHITKSYKTLNGRNVVLRDICARFPPKQAIGILGPNGVGKSTLLRIIGGAEMPDVGRVVRNGKISWPIGFAGGFSPALSGEENCKFVARIYEQDVDRIIDETRAFADIGDYFFEAVRTYSSGMRARVAFGLSMAIDFDAYLVDEVTAVGDKNFREKCNKAFDERRTRSSLIMVSHSLATLNEYCDKGAVLHKGRLEFYDTIDEAAAKYDEYDERSAA